MDSADDSLRKEYSALLGTLAHDLRGPLSGILGIVQTLLRREVPTAVSQEFLGRCESSCRRLEALINDVATVGEIDAGAVRWAATPVDVATALPEMGGGRAMLTRSDGSTVITIDPARLAQVLRNLLDAVAADTSCPATVRGAGDPEALSLTITGSRPASDNFSRGGRVGVAIAAELATLAGGRLTVEGDAYLLTLPREDSFQLGG